MDDLRRSRLTVFFRSLLVIPHQIWLVLWGIPVAILALISWLVVLIMGRLPLSFHRFFSAYLRYQTHVQAYNLLIANPFPGFTGEYGSYPVDLELPAEPQRQNRWGVFFRQLLAIPTFFMLFGFMFVLFFGYPAAWLVSMIIGRMPRGLRDTFANFLRYSAQISAYGTYYLTGRYPNSSPYVGMLLGASGVEAVPAKKDSAKK